MTVRSLLLLICTLALSADTRRAQGDPSAAWTLLFYLNADCADGDASVTPLLNELEIVGGSASVNVLVYIDRSNNPCTVGNLPTWTAGKLFRVLPGQLVEIVAAPPGIGPPGTGPNPVDPDPNLGDVSTIAWFLEMGLKEAPAEKVAMFTVGHGAPWRGLGADETPNDRLDFGEYAEGLARVLGPLQKRLALLGLIHCGTACLEAIVPLAPYAEWILASEDVTTAFSIPPSELLNQLTSAPSLSAEALARLCVEHYALSPEEGSGGSVGLALIDTRHAPATASALDRLATTLSTLLAANDTQALAELRYAKSHSMNLGCCSDQGCEQGACPVCLCCMVDLLQVAQHLAHSTNPTVASQARCLACRLSELVPYKRLGGELGDSRGVSVFLPCSKLDITDYGQSALSRSHAWGALLGHFLKQPCQGCGGASETVAPATYSTSSQPEIVASTELHISRMVEVVAYTEAVQVAQPEAWLTITLAPGAAPQLTVPATVERKGAGYQLVGRWDWTLPCLETHRPEVFVPLAVRYPQMRGDRQDQRQVEVPMVWWPTGTPAFSAREVLATLVLTEGVGAEDSGWVRRIRAGRGSGVFALLELRQGDVLLPEGAVLEGKGGEEGVAPPAPPAIISMPPRILRQRLPTGQQVWFGFSLLTADGLYREIALPRPYGANEHPAVPLIPK